MASTNTTLKALSDQQYRDMFLEAQRLKMIPYDFRVWNRYLYSKFQNANDALILRNIYVLLWKLRISVDTVGKWCAEGNFATNAHASVKRSENTHGDSTHLLKFLEDNHDALSEREDHGSAYNQIKPNAWLDQAKLCVKHGEPKEKDNDPSVKMKKEADWVKKRNSYFSFGVVVWGYVRDPSWVLENINLDTWYDLGFCVAHTNYMQDNFKNLYWNPYRKDLGIASCSFEVFFDDQIKGRLPPVFEDEITQKARPVLTRNLRNFFEKKAKGQEQESVWRLHHLVTIDSRKYGPQLVDAGSSVKGIFEKAWTDYELVGETNEPEYKKEQRRGLYIEMVQKCEDPLDLHAAMEQHGIPGISKFGEKYVERKYQLDVL